MAEKFKYFSVGELREAVKDISDDAPVVAAPLNDKIRVALDMNVVKEGKLGDYTGNIVIFNTGLFDIASGKKILLTPEEQEDEQGNN